MDSVSANELIGAGVSFRFVANDGEATFEDCDCRKRCRCPRDGITGAKGFYVGGEAAGFREVGRRSEFDAEAELDGARCALENLGDDEDIEYLDGEGALVEHYSTELADTIEALKYADGGWSEGSSDTSEMCDPYWVAVANSHVAAMRHERQLSTPRIGDGRPMHGAMEFWAAQRQQRADRLARMAKRLAKARNFDKLRTLKQGAVKRYSASINTIVKRKRSEWWMLYLTKEQMAAIRAI